MNIRSQKLGPLTVILKFCATPDSDWSIGVFGEDEYRQYGWLHDANDITDPLVDWLRELESAQVVPRLAAECRKAEERRKSLVVFVPSDDRLYRGAELVGDNAHSSEEPPLCEVFRRRGYPCGFLRDAQGGLYTIRDRAHGHLNDPVLLSMRAFGSFLRPAKFRWEVRGRSYRMSVSTDPERLAERVIATIEDSHLT